MVLNCNHYTGSIITSQYARIRFLQLYDTIYNLYYNYQKENGFYYPGLYIPKEYNEKLYEYMWYIFFYDNQSLLKEIMCYDKFLDNHGSEYVSTARIFSLLKQGGLNGLKQSCKSVRNFINEKKQMTELDYIVLKARQICEGKKIDCEEEQQEIIEQLVSLYSDKNISSKYREIREIEIYKKWNKKTIEQKGCVIQI